MDDARQPVPSPVQFDAFDFQTMQAQIAVIERGLNEVRAATGLPPVNVPRPVARQRG